MGVAAIGAVAGLAGAGASIYGASQSKVPTAQSPTDAARSWMAAYMLNMPNELSLEQAMRPAYSSMSRLGTQGFLEGTPAGKELRYVSFLNKDNRLMAYPVLAKRAAAPGLLDLIDQAQPRIESTYDQSVLRGLGLAQGAAGWLDPQGQGLNQDLAMDARQQLGLGSGLDPAARRELQQGVRAAQAARGMGYGLGDAAEEGMTIGSAAEARRRQREQYALGVNAGRPNMLTYAADRFAPAAGLGMGIVGSAFGLNSGVGPGLGMDPFRSPQIQNANNGMANGISAAGSGLMGLGGQLIGQYVRNQGAQRARVANMSDDEFYQGY